MLNASLFDHVICVSFLLKPFLGDYWFHLILTLQTFRTKWDHSPLPSLETAWRTCIFPTKTCYYDVPLNTSSVMSAGWCRTVLSASSFNSSWEPLYFEDFTPSCTFIKRLCHELCIHITANLLCLAVIDRD